jgi:malonyl-CoA/methylmalonyl-CoA synthetase
MSAYYNPLFDQLYGIAEQQPDAVALYTDDGSALRYRDLLTASAKQATVLIGAGLQPGDRLSVQVEKSPQALCLYLACIQTGVVFHPLNPDYTPAELEYLLQDAQPAALVMSSEATQRADAMLGQAARLWTLNSDGSGSLSEASAAASDAAEVTPRLMSDTVALLYSSGTTGRPKGIPLSQQNLLSNALTLIDQWQFSAADVLLHVLPIFHVHGLFVACHCALLSGASMIWQQRFDTARARQALAKATVMMGVPTLYTRLLADPAFGQDDCREVRLFISGSAPLRAETFQTFLQRSGHTILERYGMTETGMLSSNPLQGERRAGTVGFPLPGVTLRVVDTSGESCAHGEIGDIQVRGPNVFSGYWGRGEQARDDFTDDGFFRTGDQGCLDADGYLHIIGRSKDMIISGGLNVYPSEIEQVLNTCEGVKESAVIGLPHPDFGEAVAAVIDWADGTPPDEQQLRTRLQQRLAGYKIPKAFFCTDALPRNTMGKVQKAQLRRQHAEHFTANGALYRAAGDSADTPALE